MSCSQQIFIRDKKCHSNRDANSRQASWNYNRSDALLSLRNHFSEISMTCSCPTAVADQYTKNHGQIFFHAKSVLTMLPYDHAFIIAASSAVCRHSIHCE